MTAFQQSKNKGPSRFLYLGAFALFFLTIGVALGVELIANPPNVDIPLIGLVGPILRGLAITIRLTLAGVVLTIIVSLLAGIAQLSSISIIRTITKIFVEFFRGTSILVQLFWIFFVLPSPPFNIELTAFSAGVLALGLNMGAYGSEIVRGAIQSVEKGQIEASTALNMTRSVMMRRIIIPQATVRMLPPFGNLFIELLKATSLVSLITLADLTFQGRVMIQSVGRMGEIFTLLFIFYFIIAYPLTISIRWLEKQRGWE